MKPARREAYFSCLEITVEHSINFIELLCRAVLGPYGRYNNLKNIAEYYAVATTYWCNDGQGNGTGYAGRIIIRNGLAFLYLDFIMKRELNQPSSVNNAGLITNAPIPLFTQFYYTWDTSNSRRLNLYIDSSGYLRVIGSPNALAGDRFIFNMVYPVAI